MIRFSSLGDILLTAPAIRLLRARFPQSQIHLLVASDYADAAALIPGLDRVITFDRRQGLAGLWRLRGALTGRYGVLIDLQNSMRSAFLRLTTFPTIWTKAKRYRFKRWLLVQFKWNTYRKIEPVPLRYVNAAAMFGVLDDGAGLSLQIPPVTTESAKQIFQQQGMATSKRVLLCPGARHFTKRWPHERWIETARALSDRGWAVIVIGSPAEQEISRKIVEAVPNAHAVTNRSIPEIAALMSQSSAVISNDSGLMHLAAGVGIPLVAVFGPTVEEFGFYPFRANCEILAHDMNCRPCSAIGSPECPKGHFRCMVTTSAALVVAAVERLTAKDQAISS